MPSSEREESRDRELVLKHQPSFSDSGRASVPMWDSSDPDRAPPPLPLNPGAASPATKPNTSKSIALAAEKFASKARESAYTTNPSPTKSPEKSPIKGHKRLESLQNGNLRHKNSYTDALRSLDRTPSPEKTDRTPRTPGFDGENRSPERDSARSNTPTPLGRDSGRDTPSTRASRPPLRPILGENSPSSATMLALREMAVPKDLDTSLADITNKSTPNIRQPQNFDAISSQILSLTTIATSLQKEMAQLSRRSKDNATDLISLKEATNLRDEDIRKSLKDLSVNLSSKLLDPDRDHGSRAASSFGHRPGSFLLDSKPHNFEGALPKSFSVPRMGSPGFNTSDISGSTYNVETPAGIALLEKIWRDMGTKEGQEAISSALSGLKQFKDSPKTEKTDPQVIKKLEEILTFLQDGTGSRALVSLRSGAHVANPNVPAFDNNSDLRPAPLSRASRDIAPQPSGPKTAISPKAAEFVNEDLQKLLKKMKDSITEGGGMTAEVKAHLRELRGEVLGMGRDIARKLDQAESTSKGSRGDAQGPGREEIAQIVEDGLHELRSHMEELVRERRRQSASSVASRHSVDSQEVYAAVKNALVEFPAQQLAVKGPDSGIEREEILDAVREAWETYKPEIELQNFGLERDEILQCLKEGLQQYQPPEQSKDVGGATYEEVVDAVREGLQDFKPPPIETEASITREEMLMAVRECLETFEFPVPQAEAPREPEITREEVIEAVREGLSAQAPISKEIEFNREDLFEAVKAGLNGSHTPMGGVGEQVLEKMEELIDGMRIEFKQYSEANGGDTEQVLDAMKDNLEVLRRDIETYVDRAQDVTGKDEIIDTVKESLGQLREDLEESVAQRAPAPAPSSNVELLDAMEKEFEHLRTTLVPLLRSGDQPVEREEILDAIRDGLEGMKSSVSKDLDGEDSTATLNVVREEFSHLRETLATTLIQGGSSLDKEELLEAIRDGHESLRADISTRQDRPESILSGTSELLDAFNDGLDSLRNDVEKMINKPLDMTVNYEILETLKEGVASLRTDIDRLHSVQESTRGISPRDGEVVVADPEAAESYKNDTAKLEMMITQLRIKVEALDNMPPPSGSASREEMENLENLLHEVKAAVEDSSKRAHASDVSRDDIEAFETLLRNTKAKVEDLGSTESEGLAKITHFEVLETLLNETRDAVADIESSGASKKDVDTLEDLLKDIRSGMEDIREKGVGTDSGERVSKTDIEALETLCIDMKTQMEEHLPSTEIFGSKEDLKEIGESIQELGDQDSRRYELLASGFTARKIEHDHMTQCIDEVKLILEDVREELKARIKEDHHSVRDLAKTLDAIAETIMTADATATVNEVRENIKQEFEASRNASESIKEHNEENHTILLEKHSDHKQEIISDLTNKLDARFDEIMTKYDDAQLAAQAKEKSLDSKDTQTTEALDATKTAAEDLRLLVDALGSTVTDSCERMSEDSKTVFARVEEVGSKLEELVAGDGKAEHYATRVEVARTLASVESLQAHAMDYDPKIFEGIKDILSIVGQHYDQAKMATEEIKTTVNAIPGAIPLPAIAPVPTETSRDMPSYEKYDDSAVHSKLDQLMSHATEAVKTGAELAMLEQIKEQVASTSTQLSDFVTSQQAFQDQITTSKTAETEEAALALEKRIAQKSLVESDIVRLSEDKANLLTDVEALQKEKSTLTSLKSKMQADLSSLETALAIRREELAVMESRAEGLERRILDNVLDHSRSLLTTTSSTRPPSSLNEMNRKRVVSTASSNATATTATANTKTAPSNRTTTALPSVNSSTVSSGVGMALKPRNRPRNSARNSNVAASQSGGRRILSLSTLGGNRGVGGNDRAMVLANPAANARATGGFGAGGGGMMKRSHSVKSNFPSRKSSWGGSSKVGGSGIIYGDDEREEDKENSVLDEEDEEADDGIAGSEAGTERRTSSAGEGGASRTVSGTGTYTGSLLSGYSESVTGYFEGSEDGGNGGGRGSWAPSTAGTVGTRDFAFDEEGGEDELLAPPPAASEVSGGGGDGADQDAGEQGLLGASQESLVAGDGGGGGGGSGSAVAGSGVGGKGGGMVLYGQNSDSGLGTDLPTALVEAEGDGGSDYFRT